MVLKSKCKRALDKTRKLWEDAKKSGDSTIVDIHERISSEIKESEVVHGLYQEIR